MVLLAIVLIARLFPGLTEETGGEGGGAFGSTRRRRRAKGDALTSRRFEGAGATPPPRVRESLQFSRTLETWIDSETGETSGRVVTGAYSGRWLESLSQTECFWFNLHCLRDDPEAARLLEPYLKGRLGGASQARLGGGQSRRRLHFDAAITRERAYEVLGLASAAGKREIIKAHRALIQMHHPDHGGNAAQAALINQAKDTLLERRVLLGARE
jgi:hypothetical protein